MLGNLLGVDQQELEHLAAAVAKELAASPPDRSAEHLAAQWRDLSDANAGQAGDRYRTIRTRLGGVAGFAISAPNYTYTVQTT